VVLEKGPQFLRSQLAAFALKHLLDSYPEMMTLLGYLLNQGCSSCIVSVDFEANCLSSVVVQKVQPFCQADIVLARQSKLYPKHK